MAYLNHITLAATVSTTLTHRYFNIDTACSSYTYLSCDIPRHERGCSAGWRQIHAGFIESQNYSIADFYERVRQAQERDPWSHEAVFAKIMAATADFDIFMRMMREAAEEQRRKQREARK